jgi:hypothetical protein
MTTEQLIIVAWIFSLITFFIGVVVGDYHATRGGDK